jgi:hypothetical protein
MAAFWFVIALALAVLWFLELRHGATANVELAGLRRELDQASADRSYWKARAELAIDASLARAGTTPIMMAHRHQGLDPAAALRGLSMTSIPRAEDRPST